MLVDFGVQSTVLGEQQFHDLARRGLRANLILEQRNLPAYGNGCLPVLGKFEATIECDGQIVVETVLVTRGEGRCRLGSQAAKRRQVLKVGPKLENMTIVYSIGRLSDIIVEVFHKLFSGVASCLGTNLSYTSMVKLHQ